jgi:hypothetical protein
MTNKIHYIYLGGYPNNSEMMYSFCDVNSTILQIPHNKYYRNNEIIENLYLQFINKNKKIDKDTQYMFILHDFGSIYGKFLINKYFTEYNCYVIFLSIGEKISLKYSFYMFYIQWMRLNWLLYLIIPYIGNLSHRLFLQYLFYIEKIPKNKRHYFINNCSMNYLYFNILELDVNESLHPNIKSTFIRGNTVDQLFDKNNTANIILELNHWFFI